MSDQAMSPLDLHALVQTMERRIEELERELSTKGEFEERLQDSEERFRQFGQASSSALWIRDARTLRMEYMSPAFEAMSGRDCRDVAGSGIESWHTMIHADDRDAVQRNMQRVLEGERVKHEFRIVQSGTDDIRWVQSTDFPMRDVACRINRIGGIAQRVRQEDRAERTKRIGRWPIVGEQRQHHAALALERVRPADRRRDVAGATAFVFPSLYEGFGLPVLDAMTCGVPAIVSTGGALPEVVEGAGICLPPDSVEAWADALCLVCRNDKIRERLGREGRARAAQFSWRRSAAEVQRLLKSGPAHREAA